MGYLFLSIALLSGVTKGYCGKKTSDRTGGFRGAILANIIRMLLCIPIGLVLLFFDGNIGELIPRGNMLLIAALSGLSTAVFVVTWLISVKKSAYMMLDIFLMSGILLPLVGSRLLFDEAIRINQWIGIAVLFIAVVIMCSYNNSIKAKLTPASFGLLLLCGIASGVSDLSQKLFVKTIPDGSAAAFNLYTYVFAAVLLSITFLFLRKGGPAAEKPNVKGIFGYILVMALCLFANSYCKTLAAGYLDAVLMYPLSQGCNFILSAFMSAILFKEKLTAKAIVGIVIAFVGLLIINLL